MRRTSRVGERMGDPLEDLGVVPDHIHRTSRNDLLKNHEDLIAHAGSILAGMPMRTLAVEVETSRDSTARVSANTKNISRLDAYLDGRPRMSLDVDEDGVTEFELPVPLSGSQLLELRGFDGDQLVAAKRMEV
jgi:hypothetical protein